MENDPQSNQSEDNSPSSRNTESPSSEDTDYEETMAIAFQSDMYVNICMESLFNPGNYVRQYDAPLCSICGLPSTNPCTNCLRKQNTYLTK